MTFHNIFYKITLLYIIYITEKHLGQIMNKNILLNVLCTIALVAFGTFNANALSSNQYTNESKLSSGKWVKIAIPEDGVYQLTYTELAKMGFPDPDQVRIYGFGGHPISESLNGSAVDDLVQIPISHERNKIYFYACGPIRYSISNITTTTRFIREFNSYSDYGYYFVTSDSSTPVKEPASVSCPITGNIHRTTSFDYFHHEQDLISASQSGKEMLGELLENTSITIPYSLPGLCSDSSIVINPCVAARSAKAISIIAKINNSNVSLNIGVNKIYSSTSQYVFYNMAAPSGIFQQSSIPDNGNITLGLSDDVIWSRLNYFILSYYHHNNIANALNNQLRMGFKNVGTNDVIIINDATSNTKMWNIGNPNEPVNYTISTNNGISGFTPNSSSDWEQFIAFNSNSELKSIAGYEDVANQNIHGLATPDMVIVTSKALMPQAERVAQLHRDNDNMIVHVLDQQQIFNEFSSGTPDAMAIRLMNKMFYDRDKTKFKYLLMFGAGSFDNRQILSKNDCMILTYESTSSNDENSSYVSDDFFGMLEDYMATTLFNPASEKLSIGVGRIPSISVEEAQSDVDKLINYVNNPDYGPWRNNALFIADYVYDPENTEYNMHSLQADGISNLINDELNIGFMKNKVYVKHFPKDPASGFSLEARKQMISYLHSGQFFMTYVGHANPSSLSKEVQLWTTNESKTVANQHLPIVTTACCDVARFDGSQRGLMEMMFHNPNGGAIAMLAATRSAYSNGNDALNQAFVRGLFSYNIKGHMPTLGEAYMLCKQSFGTTASYNKMMFSLLGDPAMKVNYPKPFFKITKVNGRATTSNIYSGALQQVTVEAQVYTPDGSQVDATFNGDATLSIYDYLKVDYTEGNNTVYLPRKLLTQVSGRVVNGTFIGKAVIPRHTLYPGKTGMISVYAHRDNSDEIVNGSFEKLVLNSYSANNANTIHDNTPPSIEAIYFDDQQNFDLCNQVGTTATLHIHATDDYSFNNQDIAIGKSMELKLDEGKTSISDITSFASMSDNGKTLDVSLPMTLQPGQHTLQYTVYDAAGNTATQTINFGVGEQQLELAVEQEPAVEMATFNITTNLTTTPEVEIKVFNHTGNLRWQTTTSTFPLNWNLIGSNGKRLPAGIYTFYGKYNDGTNYGGTTIGTLVVADEHKTK